MYDIIAFANNKEAFQNDGQDSQASFPEWDGKDVGKGKNRNLIPYLFLIRKPAKSPLGSKKGDSMAWKCKLTGEHEGSSEAVGILDAIVGKENLQVILLK